MGTTSISKIGQSLIAQARKAYVKPMCEIRTLESMGLKMEQLSGDLFQVQKRLPNAVTTSSEQIIKPCCLGKAQHITRKDSLERVYEAKAESGQIPKLYNYVYDKFYDWAKPKILKEYTSSIKESIHLTNFDKLDGSLAVSSGFDGTVLSTDGLFQCAGLSIVDRKQSLQSLIHCYAWEEPSDMKKMLEYILKHSKPNDLEISLIPGCRATTCNTIDGVNDLIKQIHPQAKINYMNFPDNITRNGNLAIVLKNGELNFCHTDMIQNKNINPLNRIVYYEHIG